MATITAYTDLTTLVILMAIMLMLDLIGYGTRIGILYLGAGLLGIFGLGWIFTNQRIVYMSAYDSSLGTFQQQFVDPNLVAVILIIITIVSFLFVYYEQNWR